MQFYGNYMTDLLTNLDLEIHALHTTHQPVTLGRWMCSRGSMNKLLPAVALVTPNLSLHNTFVFK